MPESADEIVCAAVEAWLDRPHDVAAYGALVTAVAARRQALDPRRDRPPGGRHRRPGAVDDEHVVLQLPRDPDPARPGPTVLRPGGSGGSGGPSGGSGGAPTDDRSRGRHRRAAVPML